MRDIYFLADLHLQHRKMIEEKYRPFASVEEMNEILIGNINRVVRPGDSLYLMGDVVFQKSISEELLSRINGKKRLIVGNHDEITPNTYYLKYFQKILLWTLFEQFDFVCTHIPVHPLCFREMALNLHGHIHKNTIPDIRYMNVSAERVGYEPVHVETVARFVDERWLHERILNTNQHKIRYEEAHGQKFRGRTKIHPGIFAFDCNVKLGLKIEKVETIDYTFYGVIPTEHTDKGTVCIVDYYE